MENNSVKLMTFLRSRFETWGNLQFGVLFLIMVSLCYTISDLVPGLELFSLLSLALLALFMGWNSWRINLRTIWVSLTLFLIGFLLLLMLYGGVPGIITDHLDEVRDFVTKAIGWPFWGEYDFVLLFDLQSEILNSVQILLGRWAEWLVKLVSGQLIYDPIAIALSWSLVVWLNAIWMARAIRAHRSPLLAVLPPVVLLATLIMLTGKPALRLILPGWLSLILVALTRQYELEQRWSRHKVDTPYWLRGELAIYAALFALGVLSFAFILPEWNPIEQIEEWRTQASLGDSGSAEGDASGGALSGEGSVFVDPFERIRVGGLPRQHLLGSGPELSEVKALEIQVQDPLAGTEWILGNPRPYYWRQLTYDVYTGHGWVTSKLQQTEFDGGMATEFARGAAHRLIQQQVKRFIEGDDSVLGSGELLSIDQDFTLAWRTHQDQFGAIASNNEYSVQSLEPTFSIDKLRSAGETYPGWVSSRYLALPESLPDRLRQLAWRLTAAGETPYDRVVAIERYLREFHYNLEVTIPPFGVDVVDYFLFELQEGYCDYYATSMVVLARAAGIPARFASGYITGSQLEGSDAYFVSEADAHSWPEIYFPDIGFVRFEPTAGRPAMNRDLEIDESRLLAEGEGVDESGRTGTFINQRILVPALILLGSMVVIWMGYRMYTILKLAMKPAGETINEIYRTLYSLSQKVDERIKPGATPLEVVVQMENWYRGPRTLTGSSLRNLNVMDEVKSLVDRVIRMNYAGEIMSKHDQQRSIIEWVRISFRVRGMLMLTGLVERSRILQKVLALKAG